MTPELEAKIAQRFVGDPAITAPEHPPMADYLARAEGLITSIHAQEGATTLLRADYKYFPDFPYSQSLFRFRTNIPVEKDQPVMHSVELGTIRGGSFEHWGMMQETSGGELESNWRTLLQALDSPIAEDLPLEEELRRRSELRFVSRLGFFNTRIDEERGGNTYVNHDSLDTFVTLFEKIHGSDVSTSDAHIYDPHQKSGDRFRNFVEGLQPTSIDRSSVWGEDTTEYELFTVTDGHDKPQLVEFSKTGPGLYTTTTLSSPRTVHAEISERWVYNSAEKYPQHYVVYEFEPATLQSTSSRLRSELLLVVNRSNVILANEDMGLLPVASKEDAARGLEVLAGQILPAPRRLGRVKE